MYEIRTLEGSELDEGRAVEKTVFLQQGYPYDYEIYDGQSVMLGAFVDEHCVGVIRLIAQDPVLPPVLNDCVVWSPDELRALGGRFEEVGTVAVLPEYEHSGIGLALYCSAYGSALERNVTHWGIVMEPERVEFFNSNFFFTFSVIGELGYKGWACSPYVMNLEEAERNIFRNDSDMYELVQSYLPERFRFRF